MLACCRCLRLTFSSNLPDFVGSYFCTGSMSSTTSTYCMIRIFHEQEFGGGVRTRAYLHTRTHRIAL